MIGWLAPLALVGLIAIAGPIVVHLLRRQRAKRVPFPSLRFVQPAQTAAVRLRLPTDPWLLVARVAIVALAAVALAQPLFVTASRRAAWDQRVVRAIVVDSSESATPAAAAAREAADAEAASAADSIRIATTQPGAGLASAAAALQKLPAGRREVVVISDFQQGAITDADIAAVPANVGLRFVSVGTPPRRADFDGDSLLNTHGRAALRQRITLDGPRTAVRLEAEPSQISGIRVVPPDDRLLRTAGAAGVPAPSSAQPIGFVAGGGAIPRDVAPVVSGWMLRAVMRMQQDGDLLAAAAQHAGGREKAAPPWTGVALDKAGGALVRAASLGNELIVAVAAPPDSFVAAAALHAVLAARVTPGAWAEREVERIDPARLAAWTRAPGSVPPDAWRHSAPGDARWLWAAALLLLGVEALMRRSRPAVPEVRADAA